MSRCVCTAHDIVGVYVCACIICVLVYHGMCMRVGLYYTRAFGHSCYVTLDKK